MGERFLGKTLTTSLIDELEQLGVDACGENGEFHTLVVNCPLFANRLSVLVNNKMLHEKYWFCKLELVA
jgi:diphthamide synthase (EF-2-diphthine--ammonia ligase)